MPSVEVKTFDSPDETRPFVDKGRADVVNLGEITALRATFEPGWRWSEHLKPLAGTESCQSPHLLYVLSGRMAVRMDDGTEGEVGQGQAARIDPGHDAWVVGNEPCVVVDFGAMPSYATRRQ